MKDKTKNVVNVIFPYKLNETIWVFDDEEVNLYQEPFVGDANALLDILAEGKEKLTVFISSQHLPECNMILEKIEEEGWYKELNSNIKCWLCAAVLAYFSDYPQYIYVKI